MRDRPRGLQDRSRVFADAPTRATGPLANKQIDTYLTRRGEFRSPAAGSSQPGAGRGRAMTDDDLPVIAHFDVRRRNYLLPDGTVRNRLPGFVSDTDLLISL